MFGYKICVVGGFINNCAKLGLIIVISEELCWNKKELFFCFCYPLHWSLSYKFPYLNYGSFKGVLGRKIEVVLDVAMYPQQSKIPHLGHFDGAFYCLFLLFKKGLLESKLSLPIV